MSKPKKFRSIADVYVTKDPYVVHEDPKKPFKTLSKIYNEWTVSVQDTEGGDVHEYDVDDKVREKIQQMAMANSVSTASAHNSLLRSHIKSILDKAGFGKGKGSSDSLAILKNGLEMREDVYDHAPAMLDKILTNPPADIESLLEQGEFNLKDSIHALLDSEFPPDIVEELAFHLFHTTSTSQPIIGRGELIMGTIFNCKQASGAGDLETDGGTLIEVKGETGRPGLKTAPYVIKTIDRLMKISKKALNKRDVEVRKRFSNFISVKNKLYNKLVMKSIAGALNKTHKPSVDMALEILKAMDTPHRVYSTANVDDSTHMENSLRSIYEQLAQAFSQNNDRFVIPFLARTGEFYKFLEELRDYKALLQNDELAQQGLGQMINADWGHAVRAFFENAVRAQLPREKIIEGLVAIGHFPDQLPRLKEQLNGWISMWKQEDINRLMDPHTMNAMIAAIHLFCYAGHEGFDWCVFLAEGTDTQRKAEHPNHHLPGNVKAIKTNPVSIMELFNQFNTPNWVFGANIEIKRGDAIQITFKPQG